MEPTIQHDPIELDPPPSSHGSAMLVIVFCFSFGIGALKEALENHSNGEVTLGYVLTGLRFVAAYRWILACYRDAHPDDQKK
jgi:hypothetical protein